MLIHTLKYSFLLLLFLRAFRGSPVSIDKSIRQAKNDEILKYMNASIDPCEDFYEFTCGNYALHKPASPSSPSSGFLETINEEFDRKLKTLLNTVDLGDTTIIDQKVKSFYKSCLKLQSLNIKDKLQQLIEEFGQMPALEGDKWQEQDFDWQQMVGQIAFKYQINIFLNIDSGTDLTNSQVKSLFVSEQEFVLPKTMYRDKQHEALLGRLTDYHGKYLEIFLGLEESEAAQTATELMDLERALAKGIFDKQKGSSFESFTHSSIDELHQKFMPNLDFHRLINITWGSIPKLNVYAATKYVENLVEVLQETPKKTLANYIFFKLITEFVFTISNEKEMDSFCMAETQKYFSKNLANMFYRKYITMETIDGINRMWLDIKAAFKNVLASETLEWVAKSSRTYGIEKLNGMKLDIVSYEENDFVEKLGHLIVDDEDFLENLKAIKFLTAAQNRANTYVIPKTMELGAKYRSSLLYVSAFNAIKMPVAFLQPKSSWSASYPNAYNFGRLGFLLSHELLHGYDTDGRDYNALGHIEQKWWHEDPDNGFDIHSQCFIDQYHQYVFGGQQLPEMPNQDENIADNGGVRLAYAAYLKWSENANAVDLEQLDGLNYNHKQLFFISYGHLWCQDMFAKYKAVILNSDVHVPQKFRVIGPLSNMEEFSQEFNCPVGSYMNPVKKCKIY